MATSVVIVGQCCLLVRSFGHSVVKECGVFVFWSSWPLSPTQAPASHNTWSIQVSLWPGTAESPANLFLPIKKSIRFTPFLFSSSYVLPSPLLLHRFSYAATTRNFACIEGSASYSAGVTARRRAVYSVFRTSATVTNGSGCGDEWMGTTMSVQGR